MKKKTERNPQLELLIKLVLNHFELVDEEMEHGYYHVPEYVPYKFEDEEDYYDKHQEIVNDVCDSFKRIREFIRKYEHDTGIEV